VQLLLVEDDPSLRDALTRAFGIDGHEVTATGSGIEALKILETPAPEVVVLDLGLPDIDGLEVCRRLRARGDKRPVLMLTARDAVSDRVEGLDAGADDYLVKPFALDELLARVRALLRRTGAERDEVLRFEDLVLDPKTRQVFRG
jgi:two-component system, OmpR family, response regulator MprA